MHNRGGAEIEQLGGDGGLLGRDEDARGQVALQANGREEPLGERLGFQGARHVLVRLVKGDDAADGVGLLLEEETEANSEERAGRHVGDARARQVDNGQPTGLKEKKPFVSECGL